METIYRRIEILCRILNGEKFSKSDIAEKLHVAEISISRDINYFRNIGIPIYSKNKKLVIDPQQSVNNIISFLEKHISPISKSQFILFNSDIEKLKFLNLIAYSNFAMRRNLSLKICYRRLLDNQEKYYRIIPEKLLLNGFNLILQAVDAEDFITKNFYISRIRSIISLEKNISDYSKKDVPKETYKMHFRFNKEVAEQIKSKVWFENQKIEVLQDGRIDFFIEEEISDKLAGWCVSWWDQIEIISPNELKEYIKAMCHYFSVSNMILSRS